MFEPAYRQLAPADRAFVDEFVSRIERASELSARPMFDVLSEYRPVSEREQGALSSVLVRSAISDRIRDLVEAENVSPRRIMKEIAAIAFSSLDHYRLPENALDDGRMQFDLGRATPEQRSAVREVDIEESVRGGTVKLKFKLHDKIAALRMMGQIRGLFNSDGDAINPEAWASAGGIPADASDEEAAERYSRLISDG